ncbi:MAG: hypothetical protein WBD40_05090 [Tepidisphaeraceae bacterium]
MSRMNESESQGAQGQGQMRETAAQVQENLRNLGGQVRDAASEKYSKLREQAGEYYEHGRQRATEMEHSLEQYVQEKPIQSILIAAGVGVLLGVLWKRS